MYAETLYRTDSPRDSNPPAEFYEIGLETVRGFGRTEYRVIEIYGWWNNVEKRIENRVQTLKPELGEGYSSFDEARQRYEQQKQYRVRDGFIHLFRLEIPSGIEIHEIVTEPLQSCRNLSPSGKTTKRGIQTDSIVNFSTKTESASGCREI